MIRGRNIAKIGSPAQVRSPHRDIYTIGFKTRRNKLRRAYFLKFAAIQSVALIAGLLLTMYLR